MTDNVLQGAQLALGAIFAASAWSKVRRPDHFVEVIRGYEVLPDQVAPTVARLVMAAETAVAALLLTGAWGEVAVATCAAVLVVFLAVAIVALRRGREVECGCFGGSEERLSRATIARLAVLLGTASTVTIVWFASERGPLTLGGVIDSADAGLENAATAAALASAALVAAAWTANASALTFLAKVQRAESYRGADGQGGESP